MSENRSADYIKIAVSLLNKKNFLLCMIPLIVIAGVFLFLLIQYWEAFPIAAIVFMLAFCMAIAVGISFALANGIYCLSGKRVLLVLGMRISIVKARSIQRLSVIFREEVHDRFSAAVKLTKHDGHSIQTDHSRQLQNRKNVRLATAVYTIPAKQVDRISEKLLRLPQSTVTQIDLRGKIVWQKRNGV